MATIYADSSGRQVYENQGQVFDASTGSVVGPSVAPIAPTTPVSTLSSQAGQQIVDRNTQDLQRMNQYVAIPAGTGTSYFQQTSQGLSAVQDQNTLQGLKSGSIPAEQQQQFQPGALRFASSPAMANQVQEANSFIQSGNATPDLQQKYGATTDLQNEYYSSIASAENALNNKDYANMDYHIERAKGLQTQLTESINQLNRDMKPLRDAYIASLTPGAKEQQLSKSANDIKGQIEQFKIQTEEDKFREFEGQTLGFAGGRAAEIDIRAEFKLQRMNQELSNVLGELGLEQDARKTTQEGATTQLDWLTGDFELQQKVQERLTQEEDRLFERADALRGEAKDVLGALLDSLQGVNPDEIPEQQKTQLQNIATQAGIPFDILTSGLKVQYQREQFENALRSAQETRLSEDEDTPSTLEERNREAAVSMASQLDSVKGADGYISPDNYLVAKREWVNKGFLSKDFDERFAVYRNPKNKRYSLDEE